MHTSQVTINSHTSIYWEYIHPYIMEKLFYEAQYPSRGLTTFLPYAIVDFVDYYNQQSIKDNETFY
jgi:hypothetical protein